jgi:fatty-acyl-CoA synthase
VYILKQMFVKVEAFTQNMFVSPQNRRAALDRQVPSWEPRTLAARLDAAASKFPSRPLVICDSGEFTYSHIRGWSRDLASGLIAYGLRTGEHVALVMANYPQFVALKFAIARAGAVVVPINFNVRGDELRYILHQSDAVMLITMDEFRGHDYLADLDRIAPGCLSTGSGTLPKLRRVVVHATGQAARAGIELFDDIARSATAASDSELDSRESAADPYSTCDVIYTSGTTGRPKGVMLSHDMVLRAAYASAYTRAFEDGRRILFALPMYHVFGYVECLVASLFVGGAIIPRLAFDAADMIAAAEQHGATELVCVPTMTIKILDAVKERGFASARLIAVVNSGGANRRTIWEEIRRLLGAKEVLSGYGMTETTASTTFTLPEEDDHYLMETNGRFKLAGSAGDPSLGGLIASYKTIDPESGADLPPGESGELVARGPIVTPGYYNNPGETRAAFTRDGWLRTGDLGRISADGYLTLTGRLKETYRCGGETVMPREIEELLDQHPLVAQALAVGVPDPKMGEIGCVCIVAKGTERPAESELISLCTDNLARFKVPRHVLFMEAVDIPLTVTGRPQKFRLAAIARARLGL